MQNSQNFDDNQSTTFEAQIQSATTGLVTAVTALSPLFIILFILGLAVANGYVEYLFQFSIFGDMALMPAILLAGFRFASGMGGIQLIKASKFVTGIFFVAVSLGLTFYVSMHVPAIAATIAPPEKVGNAIISVKTILWSGFIGELMIAGYMRALGNSAKPLPALNWWKTEKATNGQAVKN